MTNALTRTEQPLARGQMAVLGPRRPWRVAGGLLMVQSLSRPGGAVRHLALQGDWLNLESWCDLPVDTRITALMPSLLQPLDAPPADQGRALLQRLLLQQRRWADDMLALRTGSVEQRLGHWLALVDRSGGGSTHGPSQDPSPSLRDIATLVDAAPETVCRVLARLRSARTVPRVSAPRPVRSAVPLSLAAV